MPRVYLMGDHLELSDADGRRAVDTSRPQWTLVAGVAWAHPAPVALEFWRSGTPATQARNLCPGLTVSKGAWQLREAWTTDVHECRGLTKELRRPDARPETAWELLRLLGPLPATLPDGLEPDRDVISDAPTTFFADARREHQRQLTAWLHQLRDLGATRFGAELEHHAVERARELGLELQACTTPVRRPTPVFDPPRHLLAARMAEDHQASELAARLAAPGATVLMGPLGCGKSALAAHAVQEAIGSARIGWAGWLDAASPATWDAGVRQLLRDLGRGAAEAAVNPHRLLGRVLEGRGPGVVVIDDAEISTELLECLDTGGVHWLVTSRQPGWPSAYTERHVEAMTSEDGTKLLRQVIGEAPGDVDLEAIVRKLGGLPGAILLAGRVLRRGSLEPAELAARLEHRPGALHAIDDPLAEVIALALEQAGGNAPGAPDLLDALLLFGSSPLPEQLVRDLARARSGADDAASLDALGGEGLLTRDAASGTFCVPATVACQRRAIASVAAHADGARALRESQPPHGSALTTSPQGHARARVLSRAAELCLGTWCPAELRAEVAMRDSYVRRSLGDWSMAERRLEEAVAATPAADRAPVQGKLATLLVLLGRPEEALALLERVAGPLLTDPQSDPLPASRVWGTVAQARKHTQPVAARAAAATALELALEAGVSGIELAIRKARRADLEQDLATPTSMAAATELIEDVLTTVPGPAPVRAEVLLTAAAITSLHGLTREARAQLAAASEEHGATVGARDVRRIRAHLLSVRVDRQEGRDEREALTRASELAGAVAPGNAYNRALMCLRAATDPRAPLPDGGTDAGFIHARAQRLVMTDGSAEERATELERLARGLPEASLRAEQVRVEAAGLRVDEDRLRGFRTPAHVASVRLRAAELLVESANPGVPGGVEGLRSAALQIARDALGPDAPRVLRLTR